MGQSVFVAPNMGCGHCRQCVSGNNNLCADYQAVGITLDGGFAEYMRIPAAAIGQGNLMPIAEGVAPAVAALTEPFACVLRGQDAVGDSGGRRGRRGGRRADRRDAHHAGPAARRGPDHRQRHELRPAGAGAGFRR